MLSMLCNVEVDLGSCVCWEYRITILHNRWTSDSWSQWRSHNSTKWDRPMLHRQLFANFEFRLLNNVDEGVPLQLIVCKKAAMWGKVDTLWLYFTNHTDLSLAGCDRIFWKARLDAHHCLSFCGISMNGSFLKCENDLKKLQNSTKRWAVWRMNN